MLAASRQQYCKKKQVCFLEIFSLIIIIAVIFFNTALLSVDSQDYCPLKKQRTTTTTKPSPSIDRIGPLGLSWLESVSLVI